MTQDNAMQPETAYQDRANDELTELNARRMALSGFLAQPQIDRTVKMEELGRMSRQLDHMNAYAQVLTERIQNF